MLAQLRMAACLGMPFRHFEPITVLHYDEGEEITDHFDFVDPNLPTYAEEIAQRGQRVVTFLVYLNDDYGERRNRVSAARHQPQRPARRGAVLRERAADGSADVRTLHAAERLCSGEKWIISQFVRDRPVL